ncbi:uncharacterized protein LOC131948428 [Physella acuta]|uniref:uncharacterized protein LOC131948428 n=1 Tax=Physella acuta TaxID=109671 RepID=UPI0027DBB608|nr:uncharacterized protein LOC131948428 [Physella acuta]
MEGLINVLFCATIISMATINGALATPPGRGGSSHERDDWGNRNYGYPGNVLSYLQSLDQRLRRVERDGCLSGYFYQTVCSDNNGTAVGVTECTESQLTYYNVTVINRPVQFTSPFLAPPTVVAGLTGLFFYAGGDLQVQPTGVSTSGFNVRITLKGILPFDLKIFWMACTKATAPFG